MSTPSTPIEQRWQDKTHDAVEPTTPDVDNASSPEQDVDDDDPTSLSNNDRLEWFDASPDLEECCTANGLTRKQFARRGDRVTSIEMFLGFWESMKSVQYFGMLQQLSIVKHPTITVIEGLESCPLLENLRIIECGLTRISNLDACAKLTQLNLSSNSISKIEHLSSLTSLQVLWLNDNQIRHVAGLGACVQLKQLWLAKNDIETLETGLDANKALEEINLAANKLSSFQMLHGLNKLPALRSLSLSDPHYGDNPVCRLCNYQTYLLCQLPALAYLDSIELTSTNKQVADTTLIKKRMYYNMRIKTIKRNVTNCVRKARSCFADNLNYANFNLNALMRELSDLEKELQAERASSFQLYPPGSLVTKRDCISQYIQQKMRVVHAMTSAYDALVTKLALLSEKTVRRLVLELNTGGNIRVEDGTAADVWYTSCVDLLKSRAFVHDLSIFGVKELKVLRVARINNRFLRNRFQERMDELLDGPDEQVKENVSKRGVTVKDSKDDGTVEKVATIGKDGVSLENSLEYLFYAQPPILDHMVPTGHGGIAGSRGMREQEYAVECGLRSVDAYAGVSDGGIKLSNSLATLDLSRLATALHVKGTGHVDPIEVANLDAFGWESPGELTLPMRTALRRAMTGEFCYPTGMVLIAKVFLGHTRHVSSAATVSQVRCDGKVGELQCLQVAKPTDPKQKCYYVLDSALILPEYLVEYEYRCLDAASQLLGQSVMLQSSARSSPPTTPLDDVSAKPTTVSDEALQDMGEAIALTEAFETTYKLTFTEPLLEQHLLEEKAKALIQMEPSIARKHAMGLSHAITPSFLLETSRQKGDLSAICDLNLTSCGLKSLQGFKACNLGNLERLVLSFNEIRRIEGLEGLVALKVLDLGYNILRSLDNVGSLANLKSLLLNNNLLYRFEDVRALGHLQIQNLDLRNNALCDAKRYRLHVIQRLPQLTTLDMATVTRLELKTAMELTTELTPLKIWTCSRRNQLRSTHAFVSALDIFQAQYLNRPSSTSGGNRGNKDNDWNGTTAFDEDGPWWAEVDELHVNHELLTKLSQLEKLTQLRVASFSDNDISYIDGLSACVRLEELELDNNQITTIENLETLVHLRVLDLGKNKLTCMKNLDALVNLKQLSLEDNDITSLQGLTHLVRLMELYIGNNHISNLKEILHLKSLPKLIIVDFSGNGCCADDEYQLYTIYNLRRVKVLDGTSVTAELQNEAKQAYSGKLTTDFLTEKIGSSFSRIQEMELSSCRIREIGSLHGDVFVNLKDLNLENNLISDISGLEKLPKLRVLNLNCNKIDRLHSAGPGTGILACPKLENLHLAKNLITDMLLLGLQHLADLKVLNLESNDITGIAGLASSRELKELYLSKNRIRQFEPPPGLSLPNLVVLKLDDNSLRSLINFYSLERLQTLDMSNNRLADMEEIERLHFVVPLLQELSIQNNPVSKRHLARSTIVFRYPSLKTLDGKDITLEERERVEVLFMHDRSMVNPALPMNVQSSPPTGQPNVFNFANERLTLAPAMPASTKTSVKLTAMSFDSLAGSQRRKAVHSGNNGVTLLPQMPQPLPSQPPPSSTRDEKDKRDALDSKEDRKKLLPDAVLTNNAMLHGGLNNSLSTSFASFSQTKSLTRPGDAIYSTTSPLPPQKTTYLAQPTGHIFSSRGTPGRSGAPK